MDENQIRQLVEKVKQGDQASFETLYMVSSRAVYFICVSFLGDEEDAKDVVQEVYVTAYEKIYQLNDGGKFVAWINQIAVNKCKKILLKKTPSFVDVEDMESRLTEENENFLPEEYITQKEKRKLVMDIMRNSLTDIQYKTVILYYFNGLTIDEIADIMECPSGTVKYRLSVARAKIRDGIQVYENRNNDKLYSVVGVPLLMRLLYEEVNSMIIPDMLPQIMGTVMSRFAAGSMSVHVGAAGDAMENVVGNAAGNVAQGAAGGILKTGIGALKVKIAIGVVAAAVVGVGAFILIKNNKSDKALDSEATYDMVDQSIDTEMENTEEITVDTQEEVTEETTAEEPEVTQSLDVIRLQAYSENRDGEDVISGHIKDISYGRNEMYNHLTILGDDGHLYSYYNDGALGYKIYDFGKPSWDISDIDIISSDIDGGSTGDFMLIEDNHYYYVSIKNDEIIGTVDGTMFDGREIRKIGRRATYPGGFDVYCEDGSWYHIAVSDLDEEPSDNFTYVDSQRFLKDFTGGKILVPDGMELKDTVNDCLLFSDGKLYMEDYIGAPIEGTEAYTFTKLYDIDSFDYTAIAITDTNDMLLIGADDGKLFSDLKTIKLPESEILDVWYARGVLLVKTADGYYSCVLDESTSLQPDEVFNSLTEDVVEISDWYVLLSDGYVYEFPSY
ncbi:MAG: RNA polymerase sigma factor [Lachnospiraceae bacterium]|nr:RNA polymerase sigma factor [Lachnospiraceae bacterium]